MSENDKIARTRLTSSRLQERNKKYYGGVNIGNIRKDISYKPSYQNTHTNQVITKRR